MTETNITSLGYHNDQTAADLQLQAPKQQMTTAMTNTINLFDEIKAEMQMMGNLIKNRRPLRTPPAQASAMRATQSPRYEPYSTNQLHASHGRRRLTPRRDGTPNASHTPQTTTPTADKTQPERR